MILIRSGRASIVSNRNGRCDLGCIGHDLAYCARPGPTNWTTSCITSPRRSCPWTCLPTTSIHVLRVPFQNSGLEQFGGSEIWYYTRTRSGPWARPLCGCSARSRNGKRRWPPLTVERLDYQGGSLGDVVHESPGRRGRYRFPSHKQAGWSKTTFIVVSLIPGSIITYESRPTRFRSPGRVGMSLWVGSLGHPLVPCEPCLVALRVG